MCNIFTVSVIKLIITRLEVERLKISTIEFLIINKSTDNTEECIAQTIINLVKLLKIKIVNVHIGFI